jgi:hypothetical protein
MENHGRWVFVDAELMKIVQMGNANGGCHGCSGMIHN